MKKIDILEKQKELEKNIREDAKLDVKELLGKYNTTYEGLSVVDIDEKLEEFGENSIEIGNNNTIFHKLKEAFINPFNVVLILVAITTFFTDVLISQKKDYSTFILILSTVLISAIISLIQQTTSDNAAKKLKQMITNKMDVIRDGVPYVVDVFHMLLMFLKLFQGT